VSRMTSIRKQSRKSARRAEAKLGPTATDARDAAIRYAESTRDWAAPKVGATRDWAAPRVEAARDWAAPRVEPMATRVKDDVMPKVASAVTAALVASEPAREEAKKHRVRKLFLLAGVIGAAVAGWKAWVGQQDRQPEPWATPIGSAPSSGTSSSAYATSSSPSTGDDAAGASPDEALADSADEASKSDTVVDVTRAGGTKATTEKVPPRAAKKAKSAADSSKPTTST
jgi:hypothetical protein